MEAIRIEGLFFDYGRLNVLNSLNLRIEAGEHLGIIGPNGAGKTTLLNVISGILPASNGNLLFFGQDVTNMSIHRRVHKGLARSFQTSRLFTDLSVLDNVLLALGGRWFRRPQVFRPVTDNNEMLNKAHELLAQINLWEKKYELVKNLAYGDQRKIDLILSLASEPKVLLLDEPSAGLAIAEIPIFLDMLTNLTRKTTLMFTSHDMDVAFNLADRVVVLYFGDIIADGPPKEVQADSRVREIYLGVEGGDEC